MTTTFTGLQQQVVAELRPLTALETWFANEVALATWQEQQAQSATVRPSHSSAMHIAIPTCANGMFDEALEAVPPAFFRVLRQMEYR